MKKERKIYLLLALLIVALFAIEFKSDLSDETIYRNLHLDNIEHMTVSTTSNIYFIPSEKYDLQIEGDEDLIENLEILQTGNDLVIRMKSIYNPFKLLKLAYESSKPINIYLKGPDIRQVKLNNREYFASSNIYENNVSKMMVLKSPRLFSKINIPGATCSALKTSNIM